MAANIFFWTFIERVVLMFAAAKVGREHVIVWICLPRVAARRFAVSGVNHWAEGFNPVGIVFFNRPSRRGWSNRGWRCRWR
jgi:hypothetical protein